MKKHILLIDPLEKLSIKKDTSMLLASTLQKKGYEVYFLFEKDFYLINKNSPSLKLYPFKSSMYDDYYIKEVELLTPLELSISKNDYLHMRLDPPFDARYLKYLWMLSFFENLGVKVINSPIGIMKYNEKLFAYAQKSSLSSYVGASLEGFQKFVEINRDVEEFILKPLDLFQGIGVEKVSSKDPQINSIFLKKVSEFKGAVVAQPFYAQVKLGEIRSIFYDGVELGSILKRPKDGNFLANIAQGASFEAIELDQDIKNECEKICHELSNEGVHWVAFDIMGKHISEVNITCPGLLNEVGFAHQKNLALKLIELIR